MSRVITRTILLHFLRTLMDATVALMLPDVKKDCIFILKNSNTHVILYSTMALFNSHLVFKTYRTNKSFHICINKLNRIGACSRSMFALIKINDYHMEYEKSNAAIIGCIELFDLDELFTTHNTKFCLAPYNVFTP